MQREKRPRLCHRTKQSFITEPPLASLFALRIGTSTFDVHSDTLRDSGILFSAV